MVYPEMLEKTTEMKKQSKEQTEARLGRDSLMCEKDIETCAVIVRICDALMVSIVAYFRWTMCVVCVLVRKSDSDASESVRRLGRWS